ncbi:hypothetical protein [Loktanella sp. SALINAS62]|uniref:hypothetical protein n=1 Tax=Loktanella sp. SALINAS62 TaxID=2706124 RepID=UPI001B8BD119|nr:hypothetical protein [Loktanella sp. SALINAS62]MBS1302989.1 hypothetical protein [Loktanella sp. SALINAS62]
MELLLPLLTFGTLGIVLCLAIYSTIKNGKEARDDSKPKSGLAKDGRGPNPMEPPHDKTRK